MGNKKTSSIGSRLDPQLRARLSELTRRYGPNDATMLTDALTALCDYVEREEKYQRPMMMVFDAEADAFQRQLVAEGKEPTPMVKRLAERAAKAAEGKPAAPGKPSRAGSK